jgi:hypothetical protein
VESSKGVKVTVEELYKMDLEKCMDTATGGLYSGGVPLERVGPTRREFFEETMDHHHHQETTPLMTLEEEIQEQEQQEEERQHQNERSHATAVWRLCNFADLQRL